MKKFILFIAVLTVLIAACAPVIPENGIATPVVITAEMSTVLPEIPVRHRLRGLHLRLYLQLQFPVFQLRVSLQLN